MAQQIIPPDLAHEAAQRRLCQTLGVMNRPRMIRLLFSLVTSWLISAQCFAQAELDFVTVSDVLFPESRNWPLLTSFPQLTAPELDSLKNSLAQAYRSTASSQSFLEGPACSFIQRAFNEPDLAAFRRLDLNQDGFPDIVYSGSAHCAEGDGTVIWFGSTSGYTVREPAMWPLLLLRVSQDEKKVTSVGRGCCGAPSDAYFVGNVSNFRQGGEIQVLQDTALPKHRSGQPLSFTTGRPVRLRSTPKILDAYDQGRSEFLGHAAFGNVVRTYMPGATGHVLGTSSDKTASWLFVVIDSACDPLVLQDPYRGTRAGWLRANQVEVPGK